MLDNVFGELEYDFLWEGKTSIIMFGKQYEIGIGIIGEEEDGIQQIQRDAYTNFKNNETEIIKNVLDKVYEYYKYICEFEPEKIDPGVLDKLPKTSNYMDMMNLITPTRLCIPELDDDREIDILFDCVWDFELGMGVQIINEVVTMVGVQNDVL